MPNDQQVGTQEIRSRFYDKTIKGITEKTYKFKQLVTVISTSAWKNFFYREDPAVLSVSNASTTRGLPRGANFPQAVAKWQLISKNIEKYGIEDNIFWEDILSNDIGVQSRTLVKLSEKIAKDVDDQIWADLGGTLTTAGTSNENIKLISSFSIIGKEWNETSAAILDDLMRAKQILAENYYPTDNLKLVVSPRDHRSIINYVADKGTQFPKLAEGVMTNGNQGNLAGFDIIVSPSVTASGAMVVVPQRCANWVELVPLQSTSIEDPYKSVKIRCVEEGALQLTDPKAIVMVLGTQNSRA